MNFSSQAKFLFTFSVSHQNTSVDPSAQTNVLNALPYSLKTDLSLKLENYRVYIPLGSLLLHCLCWHAVVFLGEFTTHLDQPGRNVNRLSMHLGPCACE